mgnify:CR=1 FL=1
MIDIRGNEMDKTIEYLRGISESFDLTIEDRTAISTAIETIRERNKTVYIVTLLEHCQKKDTVHKYFLMLFGNLFADLLIVTPTKSNAKKNVSKSAQ